MFRKPKPTKTEKQRLETIYNVLSISIALVLGIAAALTSYSQIFYPADEVITNFIYSFNPFETADDRITIISIDDETISNYGDYDDWSRSILADTVNILSENNAAIIGLDVDLSSEKDTTGDEALVEACKDAGNVVAIATADFNSANETIKDDMAENEELPPDAPENGMTLSNPADSSMNWSDRRAEKISFPYKSLNEVVTTGVSNATQRSFDGTIRSAALSISYDEGRFNSFASTIYMMYNDKLGLDNNFPDTNSGELFGFNPIYNTGSYQIISLSDLLSGNYDAALIDEHITIIGSLKFPDESMKYYEYLKSDYSQQEVLTETAIIHTLLNNKSIEDVARLPMAIIYGITITAFFSALRKKKKLVHIILQFLCIYFWITIAYTLNSIGQRLLLLIPIIFAIIAIIVNLIFNLIYANFERKKLELTLKLYVDSQVVDEISEFTPLELSSVSTRRNIAVLFVDIRGFTTMSESLEPEQVVSILNEYFSVVYSSIMAWNGTLDKFIGDAAMAIFNAPKDVDDYVFSAVCAADDIQQNFEPLRQKFLSEYGKDIQLGIGINYGTAIVGNIGCMGRFDYTAIGDTVNTASRLESKAAPGQILISEDVYREIQDRVTTTRVGALALKGKSNTVETFQIDTIDKPKAPNELLRKGFLREQNLLHSKTK